MRRIVVLATLAWSAMAMADVWSPMEFYIGLGNPEQGAVQKPGAVWTFRRGSYNGTMLTGIRGALTCEGGFGLWGRQGGPYGFLPCVGPRLSPDENLDKGTEADADFDGLMVIPTNDEDAFLVFTASGPVAIPALTLRGEMTNYFDIYDGVRLTVRTRISDQTTTWLDKALVPDKQAGFEEWTLFQDQHPQMQKGDKLWIQVDCNGNYNGDWANVSLESGGCHPDCTGEGTLDLFDFLCFVNSFNAGEGYADCDGNGARDLFDFLCFVNAFNAGC